MNLMGVIITVIVSNLGSCPDFIGQSSCIFTQEKKVALILDIPQNPFHKQTQKQILTNIQMVANVETIDPKVLSGLEIANKKSLVQFQRKSNLDSLFLMRLSNDAYQLNHYVQDTPASTQVFSTNKISIGKISNFLYERISFRPGEFASSIIYSTKSKNRYRLIAKNFLNEQNKILLEGKHSYLALGLANRSRQISYTTEGKKAFLYIKNFDDPSKNLKIPFPLARLYSSSWSPDDSNIALAGEKDGNVDIYLYRIKQHRLKRLTYHTAKDYEVFWANDNKHLIFTSNRSGKDQIYEIQADGRSIRRISLNGQRVHSPSQYSKKDQWHVVAVQQDPDTVLVSLNNEGIITKLPKRNYKSELSIKFSPRGSLFFLLDQGGGEIHHVDDKNGSVLKLDEDIVDFNWSQFNWHTRSP